MSEAENQQGATRLGEASHDPAMCLPACIQCLGTQVICVECAQGGTGGCVCPNGPDETEPCPCVEGMMNAVVVIDEQAEFTQEHYESLLGKAIDCEDRR